MKFTLSTMTQLMLISTPLFFFIFPHQITSYKTAIKELILEWKVTIVNKLLHHTIFWHQIYLILIKDDWSEQYKCNECYIKAYSPNKWYETKETKKTHLQIHIWKLNMQLNRSIELKHNRKQIVHILKQSCQFRHIRKGNIVGFVCIRKATNTFHPTFEKMDMILTKSG